MYRNLIIGLVISFVAGCSATIPRGVVAMKISDEEAHVCLRKQEVQLGQMVVLFRNICTRNTTKPILSSCELKRIGTGKITGRLNDHYSVVRFQPGIQFNDGDVVEVEK